MWSATSRLGCEMPKSGIKNSVGWETGPKLRVFEHWAVRSGSCLRLEAISAAKQLLKMVQDLTRVKDFVGVLGLKDDLVV